MAITSLIVLVHQKYKFKVNDDVKLEFMNNTFLIRHLNPLNGYFIKRE